MGCGRRQPAPSPSEILPQVGPTELRAPEAFGVISDRAERSRALFLEASRVLLHPRCANCHPDGDMPYQGTGLQLHDPPVLRGPEDRGIVGMECTSCHQDRNVELTRVPGAPNWHLAPLSMAWVGRTPRGVCEQLKDPARNGGKSLAQIVEHNAHDELVGWGWRPGADREPAPGTQERFGAIVAAWVETGAECPSEEARP
ncbi:Isoquinoline 1-oxidoreductase subunit [Archangium sp.]|uniref:Isoquinoline 1-oxidoreductase subunit n=1 Tax=Archangium sp. TaxID=1872627 RepID=UPI002D55FE86|nr:Isoquinoline 1-oxidoreductase subunit [Archangium sp.]HYO59828.1 Isoquinoline 1-oxidoreductase subunit [Archangium sp.]